jgi:hypothetical protein
MPGRSPPLLALALVGNLALGLAGCAFGPRVLERTHGLYNEAIRQVNEEQFLRNIVHMRYTESILDLDVNAIAAQYELSSQAEARPFFLAPNPGTTNNSVFFKTFTSILPNLQLSGANRPTISLTPDNDGREVRRFLTPIALETVIFLARTSWPPQTVLRIWVERLNGVPNAVTTSGPPRDVVPDFARFLRITELLQTAQDRELATVQTEERLIEHSGPLPAERVTAAAVVEAAKNGMEYRPRADGKTWALVRRERRLVVEVSPGAEGSPELLEVERLLNVLPGRRRYDLAVTGRGAPDPLRFPTPPSAEIRLAPRSTLQAMFFLANGVEVPAEHLCRGLIRPALDERGQVFDMRAVTRGLFEVHAARGHKPPATAYVAVKYRGYWYYIDDRDQASKSTLALMLQLTRLDFARQRVGGPVLTLPTGR